MRRGSPGYYTKSRSGASSRTPYRCLCQRAFWTFGGYREHQRGCSAVRLAKAAETKGRANG